MTTDDLVCTLPEERFNDARSEARYRAMIAALPKCVVCKGGMVVAYGRDRHHLCDPNTSVGRACVCPVGCSDHRYGDGVQACDPECVPCRMNRGQVVRGRDRK